jgi:3-hydroxybutyryl-CoA dehydratase
VTEQLVTAGVGQELPVLTREVNQEGINRYAAVSGDGNPLHTDPAFAATTRFGGPIAHGMLVLAYVSECLTAAFGERWLASGRLKVRFRGPAHPGDTVTVSGRVTRRDGRRLFAEVEAQNQQGEPLITADAEVEV